MPGNKAKISVPEKLSLIRKIEKSHPVFLFTWLFLISMSVFYAYIILNMILAIISNSTGANLLLSEFYVLSTVLIALSLWWSHSLIKNFKEESILKLIVHYLLLFVSGTLFFMIQFTFLPEVPDNPVLISDYLIIRDFTLIAAIPAFLIGVLILYIFYQIVFLLIIRKDPVRQLLYFSFPFQLIKIRILVIIWQFLSYIWIIGYLAVLLFR